MAPRCALIGCNDVHDYTLHATPSYRGVRRVLYLDTLSVVAASVTPFSVSFALQVSRKILPVSHVCPFLNGLIALSHLQRHHGY